MSKSKTATTEKMEQVKKILGTLGQKKQKGGAQAKIYRKYEPKFKEFLTHGAKHDIDGDGKLWCKKEEWCEWLIPQISTDDGNAIGYKASKNKDKNATTASEMEALIQKGKEYICHRIYNQLHIAGVEIRKKGGRTAYFRFLEKGEKSTPPTPDSFRLLKSIFKEKGQKVEDGIYELGLNEACDYLIDRLPPKFNTEDAKIKEWQRVIGILEMQNLVKFDKGSCAFNEQGW